jgi:hypothetical protein
MHRPAIFVVLAAVALCSVAAEPPAAQPPKAPRAARSVHLQYPGPEADAFYNELTVEQSVPGSYFMACGFRHGYFGIQEQSRGQKVVIFSVWDPTKGDDAKNVPLEQRVEVLHQDKDVEVKRFGGEGTGGQSFFKFDWKTGDTYRFCVRAKVEDQKTAYSGYFYLPETKTWKHLVTFRTKTGGDRLKGLYSFVEDFKRDTKSATQSRRAVFSNGWVHAGEWKPLLTAGFTASSSTWEAKETIDAGIADGRFYLQTGGDTKTSTPLNSKIERPTAPDSTPPDVPAQ